ncbi:hypothetical protein [Streptomyces sp. NPDC051001]|uniref:hypothetical protein n=1 Tax=Streptomyces sp. NPDC051001 TaxID=3155795 RepID=UPI00341F0F0D
MSSEKRSLGGYIQRLVALVDEHDPVAGARLRQVAGDRTALVGLDEEWVLVRFTAGRLVAEPAGPGTAATGSGRTDRATVRAILLGRAEVSGAVLDGGIHLAGRPDDVAAMSLVVEILLDVSARTPPMRVPAEDFFVGPTPEAVALATAWYPAEIPPEEKALLGQLGLLP